MDSTTLLLVVLPILVAVVSGAVKFMRLVGFVASGGKPTASRGRNFENPMSFDERVAERLREMNGHSN